MDHLGRTALPRQGGWRHEIAGGGHVPGLARPRLINAGKRPENPVYREWSELHGHTVLGAENANSRRREVVS